MEFCEFFQDLIFRQQKSAEQEVGKQAAAECADHALIQLDYACEI